MDKQKEITYLEEESEDSASKTKLIKLKKKLKQCQQEKEEYLSQMQRARADLINYQKRQEKLTEELKKFGQAKLVFDLLPVLDSLKQGAKQNQEIKCLKDQFESILKHYQLNEIKTKQEKFDPNFHEAIDQVESEQESGMIIEEVQKGYLLGDKVLRPARVRVAK